MNRKPLPASGGPRGVPTSLGLDVFVAVRAWSIFAVFLPTAPATAIASNAMAGAATAAPPASQRSKGQASLSVVAFNERDLDDFLAPLPPVRTACHHLGAHQFHRQPNRSRGPTESRRPLEQLLAVQLF